MDKQKKERSKDVTSRELLSKRVIEEDEDDQDDDSLKEWTPADAALDALPPVNETVEVFGLVYCSLTWSSSSKSRAKST